MKGFKDYRRRVKQQALQSLGVASQTEDNQFKDEYGEFKETCKELKNLKKSMANHLDAIKKMHESAAALSVELAAFHQHTEAAKATVAYGKAHAETERVQLTSVERLFEEEVKAATDLLLWQVPEIEEKVKQRKKLLLDYDAHMRKYDIISNRLSDATIDKKKKILQLTRKRSEGEIAVELTQRKLKLEQAEEAVDDSTKWLLEKFEEMSNRRESGSLLQGPMSALLACELHLLESTAKRLEALKPMFDSVEMFSTTLEKYDKEPQKVNTFDVDGVAHITNIARSSRRKFRQVKRKDGLVFGLPIQSTAPALVSDCINFLKENGMETEGLFRIPGSSERVEMIRERYDNGEKAVLSADDLQEEITVHDVCTLLKLWFRELEEPLIPTTNYEALMNIVRGDITLDDPATTTSIIHFTTMLPEKHRGLLHYISNFLHEVTTFSDANKMTAANLATCFAPSMMRAPEDTPANEVLRDMPGAIAAVKVFILHATKLPSPKHQRQKQVVEPSKVDLKRSSTPKTIVA